MSFIQKLVDFIHLSRVGKLFGVVVKATRKQIDTDGNGKVSVEEVQNAIPKDVSSLFKPDALLKNLPTIIQVVIDLQKALKKD